VPIFSPEIPLSVHFDFDLGGGGWGNNELQTYTSFPPNAFHSPHRSLILRAIANSRAPAERDRFTSARLLSKQRLARRRGYLSAVIAAPSARGVWPAFWLLPEEPFKWPEDGEVDVFEAWDGNQENHSCLHWGGYSDPGDKKKHRVANTSIQGITQPHEYGFAWEQPEWGTEGGKMVWYVDGRPVLKADKPPGTRRFEGWRVLLNIAMGGTVCHGSKPRDGSYQMEIFALTMKDDPPGGWSKFEEDWNQAHEGRTLD
jgi:beta-glucanase (GH16 family)